MAPFEALYGWRCRSPIGWFEVGESSLLGPYIIHGSIEKVQLIRDILKTAYSRQTSYADNRRRDLDFEIGDHVYLKISPMKEVIRFGRKGKLSSLYVGSDEDLHWIWKVSYELKKPSELASVYSVFHVFMIKKCIGNPVSILPMEGLEVKETSPMKRFRLIF